MTQEMAKKKMDYEETLSAGSPSRESLKDLAVGEYRGQCASGKQGYEYDSLRGRKRKTVEERAEGLSNRIWFDDLPPHTD